jgi:hypothetical protein
VGAKYWLAERNGLGMNVQNKPHEKSNPLILKGLPKLKFTTIYYEATM